MGLDKEAVKEKANSVEVNKQIVANRDLGRSIGVSGTPAFIIGDRLVPGAIDYNQMVEIIKEQREQKNNPAE